MVDKKQKKDLANVGSQNTQQEDVAMKTLALFFAEELFPLVNIKGKVKRVAPTEIVHLELKKMYQDFNYEMEDNSWVHLEFQSTNEYYGSNVPLFRRNGYRQSGTMIP